MKKEYEVVIRFFGDDWFQSHWERFRAVQTTENRNSFSSKLILNEISLHPVLADVFRFQNLENEKIDFSLIKPNSSADYYLSHLGRDLSLLEREINERGSLIKRDLLKPLEYESHRFNLMVAAGYKIEGYKIEFVPTSKIKRADLLVSRNNAFFYIENKRLNQQVSDQPRYAYFAGLVEETMGLLRYKNLNSLIIGIDAKGNINKHCKPIYKAIQNKIWRNQLIYKAHNLVVKYSILEDDSVFYRMLKLIGHFNQTPIFTRAEDFLIASDPVNKNVILLNKDVSPDEIPTRANALLDNANSKQKEDKKLIVYLDIGRGMSEWNAKVSDYINTTIKKPINDTWPNIDVFVVCQTGVRHLGGVTQIKPDFNLLGSMSNLGGRPETFSFFGLQGHTGMDNYLIKDFLNPVPYSTKPGQKFIECLICGNKIIGLATNLQEGELLSQVKMPCDQCGSYMDMTLKITK